MNEDLLSSSEFRKKLFERINSISSTFNISYPINPKIRYEYPEINEITIQNIVNALISCPKFYIQTLHLMNKMNLPCPLVSFVRTARPPIPNQQLNTNLKQPTIDSSSESEIEIESEKESIKRVSNEVLNKSMPKRLKVQAFLKTHQDDESKNKVQLDEIFENQFQITESTNQRVELKQYDRQVVQCEGEGFAKIIPIDKSPSDILVTNSINKLNEESVKSDFITLNELEKNRLKISEMKQLPLFKSYEKGETSSRLYIKNLAKNVQESDLKYIFGRYVDWNNEISTNSFDIRLMKEGRMKGQAFITFAREETADRALSETNGYMLFDKPLVISFARSAKPK